MYSTYTIENHYYMSFDFVCVPPTVHFKERRRYDTQ